MMSCFHGPQRTFRRIFDHQLEHKHGLLLAISVCSGDRLQRMISYMPFDSVLAAERLTWRSCRCKQGGQSFVSAYQPLLTAHLMGIEVGVEYNDCVSAP